ncbi:MAG: hypothetical protein K2N22_05110 [Clostridia bacterium]|nr:hypothetical protein [Clostridia bacterium]
MKKLLTVLLALCAAVAVCVFAGCADDPRGETEGAVDGGYKICYAFTASDDVLNIGENTSLKDYMDALKAGGKLDFKGEDGDYGYYLTEILGVKSVFVSSTANSYAGYDWYVYTTLTTVDGVTYSSEQSFVFDGVTLYKSAYGVSNLPCVKGESYALVFEYAETTW